MAHGNGIEKHDRLLTAHASKAVRLLLGLAALNDLRCFEFFDRVVLTSRLRSSRQQNIHGLDLFYFFALSAPIPYTISLASGMVPLIRRVACCLCLILTGSKDVEGKQTRYLGGIHLAMLVAKRQTKIQQDAHHATFELEVASSLATIYFLVVKLDL